MHHAKKIIRSLSRSAWLLVLMASAAAQSITLDNFNTPGATGDVITTPIATSWVFISATRLTIAG